MTYETIKHNFERKLWSASMVAIAVQKGIISPEQFQEITGEKYSDE